MSLSIVVAQSGYLGMNIKSCLQEKGAFIDSFYRTSSGKLLPAERNSKLLIGDVVESINGTNVLNHDLDNIYKELEVAQRPMEICFKRYKTKFNMKSLLRDSRKSFWINHFLQSIAIEKSTILANKITLMCIFDCIDELSHLNSCEDIVRLFILESFDTDYLHKIEYDLSTELHHSLFELHESLRSNVEVESQAILKVFRSLHSWLSDELLIEFHEPFRVSASAQKMTGWLADSAVYYQLSVRDMLGNAVLWPFLYTFLCQIHKQHMVQEFMSGCDCQVGEEHSATQHAVERIARDLLVQGVMVQFYSSQVYHTLLSELEICSNSSSSSVPLVLTERTKVENSISVDHTLSIKHNAVSRLFRSTELPSGMSKYSYDSKNKCITAATEGDVNNTVGRAIPYTLVQFDTAISTCHHGDIDHSSSSSSSSDGSSSSSSSGSRYVKCAKCALEYTARDVHNYTHHISAALQSTHTLHSPADDVLSIAVGDAILPFFVPTEKLVLLVKSDPATTSCATSEDSHVNCNGADSSDVQTVYDIYAADTSNHSSSGSSCIAVQTAIESIVQPESRLFNFVMTNKKGEKIYGSSLVMYKPVEVPIACNHNETDNTNSRAVQFVSLKRVDANSSRSKRTRIFDDNTPTTVDNEEYSNSNNSNNDIAGNNALTTAANQLLSHISSNLYSGMRTAIALGTALPITPIFVDEAQQTSQPQQLEPLHQASRSQLQSKPPPPTTPRPVAAQQQKQPHNQPQPSQQPLQTALVTTEQQQQQQPKHKRSHTIGTLTTTQLQQFRVSSPAKMNRYLSSWSSMFQSSLFSAGPLSHTAAPFSGMLRDDTDDEFVIRQTRDVTTNNQAEELVAVTATATAAASEAQVMQQGIESSTAVAVGNNADRVDVGVQREVSDKVADTAASNSDESVVTSDSQHNEVAITDSPVVTTSFAASPSEIPEPSYSLLAHTQKSTTTSPTAQHATLFAAHGVCILTRDPLVDTLRAALSNCPQIHTAAMDTHCNVLLQIQRHIEKSGSMTTCDAIANEHCSDRSSSMPSPSTRSVSASVSNQATGSNNKSSSRNSSSSTIPQSIRVTPFSSLDFDPYVIYDLLSPAHLVTLFLSTLLEYKIIFVSAISLNISLQLGEFLRAAVKPLKYCHVYAPVLPQSVALELLHCPTPYMVGLLHTSSCSNSSGCNNSNSGNNKALSCISLDKLPSDAVVVEVDSDRVHVPPSLHKALRVGTTLVKRVSQLTRAELWELDSVLFANTSTGTKTPVMDISGPERQHLQHCEEETPMTLFHSFVAELLSDIRQCCVVFETAPTRKSMCTEGNVGKSSESSSGSSGASVVSLSVHTTDSDTVVVSGGSAAGVAVSGRQGVIVFDENAYCAVKVIQRGSGDGNGGGGKSSELHLVPRKQEAFFRLLVRSQCFSEHVTALYSGELPAGDNDK